VLSTKKFGSPSLGVSTNQRGPPDKMCPRIEAFTGAELKFQVSAVKFGKVSIDRTNAIPEIQHVKCAQNFEVSFIKFYERKV